ncbi:hypothetical protein PLESTM_001666100 [Pleodorina starrii]|nr:hypothetical protein PLESTM_001666100 [Pleodorina starrii]
MPTFSSRLDMTDDTTAILTLVVDDFAYVLLNGQSIGTAYQGWSTGVTTLSLTLKRGMNTLSIRCQNTGGPAGLLLSIRNAATGQVISRSNSSWGFTQEDTTCDCDYHPGGCRVSRLPAAGAACKCTYKGAWTCGGAPTLCADPKSEACQRPKLNDVATCVQGGGDCGGQASY